MKHLLVKKGGGGLTLFFNGWGMDSNQLNRLDCVDDLIVFYDYESPVVTLDMEKTAAGYESVSLIAWSLGVWAAAEALEGKEISLEFSLAVNGTLSPIDSEFGIPPALFEATLENWDEEARGKFYRRICGKEGLRAFCPPERSARGQKEELKALGERISARRSAPPNPFGAALICGGDKIFPPEAQERAWGFAGVKESFLEAPHYPFHKFQSVKEVFDFAAA